MAKRSVRDLNVAGQRVLIRADLNVPLAKGKITDDRRITQFLPTLRDVLERGGRAILMSHLGRPTGEPATDAALSLRPVADRIAELLGRPCAFAGECIGGRAAAAAGRLKDGEALLLENLRFHDAETVIDKAKKNADKKLTSAQDAERRAFGDALASLGDAYVNDAFGTCHRKHVSMYDVPLKFPEERRAIGFLIEKELKYLGDALNEPKRPFVAVLGGAKVSDKIGVIKALLGRVDRILIGGAMAFTFWAAQGRGVGRSLCERDMLDLARSLIADAGDKLVLPSDAVAASRLAPNVESHTVAEGIPDDLMGLDIGPETVAAFTEVIRGAGTVVWNGPVGAFETPPFHTGTMVLAHVIAEASDAGTVSVIGGGDSAAAVEEAGLADRMTHISTGGGASLSFLEGKRFDPIEIIPNA